MDARAARKFVSPRKGPPFELGSLLPSQARCHPTTDDSGCHEPNCSKLRGSRFPSDLQTSGLDFSSRERPPTNLRCQDSNLTLPAGISQSWPCPSQLDGVATVTPQRKTFVIAHPACVSGLLWAVLGARRHCRFHVCQRTSQVRLSSYRRNHSL